MTARSPRKKWQQSALLRIIAKQKPYFEPGCGFHYSNANYIVLGFILEKVYNQSIQELITDKLAEPLGFTSTSILQAEKVPKNLITGYDRALLPRPGLYQHKPDNTAWASLAFSAGAMVSTAKEVAGLLYAVFNTELLSGSSLEAMTRFYSLEKSSHPFWSGYVPGMTRFDIDGVEYWGHAGAVVGFELIVVYHPVKKYSIALIGNISSFNRFAMIKQILKILESKQKHHNK